MKFFRNIFNIFYNTNSKDYSLSVFIKNTLNIVPNDLNLYKLSLTHRSIDFQVGKNNERLEFLGDSILQTVVSSLLYKKYPDRNEGFLTKYRSAIVNKNILEKLSIKINIDSVLLLNDKIKITKNMRSDALEALFGAIFLDQGYFKARDIISKLMSPYLKVINFKTQNPKGYLLEWSQRNKKKILFVNEEKKTKFENYFETLIYVEDILFSKGSGHTKKDSDQNASKEALKKI